jgi:hypothetical protein
VFLIEAARGIPAGTTEARSWISAASSMARLDNDQLEHVGAKTGGLGGHRRRTGGLTRLPVAQLALIGRALVSPAEKKASER